MKIPVSLEWCVLVVCVPAAAQDSAQDPSPRLQELREQLGAAKSVGEIHAVLARTLEFIRSVDAKELESTGAQSHLFEIVKVAISRGAPAGRGLAEALVAAKSKTVPSDSNSAIESRFFLAVTTYQQGDDEVAVRLLQGVLDDRLARPKEHAERLLPTRMMLGGALVRVNQAERALEQFEAAYRESSEIFPENHEHLIAIRVEMAAVLQRLSRFQEAEKLASEMLALLEARVPPNHPDMLSCLRVLAACDGTAGRSVSAVERLRRLVEARRDSVPPDDRVLLEDQENLATQLHRLDRFAESLALFENIAEQRSKTLPASHQSVLEARVGIARAYAELGSWDETLEILEDVHAIAVEGRSEQDQLVDSIRLQLAWIRKRTGNLDGARELFEAMLAAQESVDPESLRAHRARAHLAEFLYENGGNIQNALAMTTRAVEGFAALGHASTTIGRDLRNKEANLHYRVGNHERSIELNKQLIEEMTSVMPADHADIHMLRNDLIGPLMALGRIDEAFEHSKIALEAVQRLLPPEHLNVLRVKNNHSTICLALGDYARARTIQEELVEIHARILPEGHRDRQHALQNLQRIKSVLGDVEGARALAERILQVREATHDPSHISLIAARTNLASLLTRQGERERASELRRQVLDGVRAAYDEDHPLRIRLFLACADELDKEQLEGFLESLIEHRGAEHPFTCSARYRLAMLLLRSRELEAAHRLFAENYALMKDNLDNDHDARQDARRDLLASSLLTADYERGIGLSVEMLRVSRGFLAGLHLAPRAAGALARGELGRVRLAAAALQGLPEESPLRPELAEELLVTTQYLRGVDVRAARRAKSAADADAEEAAALEAGLQRLIGMQQRVASSPARDDNAFSEIVRGKEQLQRRLLELASRNTSEPDPTIEAIAAGLGPKSAAVGFTRYSAESRVDAMLALVLRHDRSVRVVDLGLVAELEELVRGFGRATSKRLRKLVIDPILGGLDGVEVLHIALDESLELVPIDALPMSNGVPLGARMSIRPVSSLFELAAPHPAVEATGETLLAFGGIDYETSAAGASTSVGVHVPQPPLRGDSEASAKFVPLPGTDVEVRVVADAFRSRYENGTVQLFTGEAADKSALLENSSDATILHFATHGYFAPESVASGGDDVPSRDRFAQLEQPVSALSPLALCGLALSGANRGANDVGDVTGILTAEEAMWLDLRKCRLAVISACDASVGVRRAGQGHASLRRALHGAGARYVLASLWKVDDVTTRELMGEFYRRLWEEGAEPQRALWEAKMAIRQRGADYREWAGWTLSGR